MSINIGINGFGRIGRIVLRRIFETGNPENITIKQINDLTDAKTLAHLVKYDSVHGKFNGEVTAGEDSITINGVKIPISSERDPKKLAWGDKGVDIVLECTGVFRTNEKASWHLEAGAKKVLISAPSPDPDTTIAFGVNSEVYNASEHNILSCASCTTNCLAPVAKVILENFGITRGLMTTTHSYTNDQKILDLPHSDLRRARAAAMSMIPTTTGAAKALGLVIPELLGKVDGFAVRVPTSNVSMVDFVVELEREATKEEVNRAFKKASENSLASILGYSEEPLVSTDYVGNKNSATIDALSTMVIDNKLVKVLAWYDNEVGFSNRMVDVCKMVASSL